MKMIFEHQNYRSFLKAQLAMKITSNPQFSLRSFSQHLGLSHSTLSLVLKGSKNLSYERAMDVATKLKLSEIEQEYFCLLVQIETMKDPEKRSALLDRLNKLRPANNKTHDLNIDIFKTISDWYHFPILSMTRLKDFQYTPENIAKRLGISSIEVQVAIERLLRLELLEVNDEGKYKEAKSYLMTTTEVPNSALKKFHKQLLEKALASIEDQDTKDKVNGSETFAFNPKHLPEARKITNQYYDQMVELSERSQEIDGATDVFHLQVNFFNLTDSARSHK